MKTLKESFIKAKDLDKIGERWPNPYNLTEEDKVNNMPLEIITLIIKEAELCSHNFKGKKHILKYIKDKNIDMLFFYDKSKDGGYFWWNIIDGNYDVFYDKYTPEKLKKRLEEK